MNWNDDWRDELKTVDYGCYVRLCECRNTRKDLLTMSRLVFKYNPTTPPEECVIRILEWVGEWNGQYMVTDLTTGEYNDLIKSVDK